MSVRNSMDKPPIPRRSQSVKIVRNLSVAQNDSLSNSNNNEDPSKYKLARPINKRAKCRKSLDAMEKQASELLDFLSELENKKASCNDSDILDFLSDSKQVEPDQSKDSDSQNKFGDRVRRVSVRDRAKLFLKADIKEEPDEGKAVVKLDKNSNRISNKLQPLSLPKQLIPCNGNNRNSTASSSVIAV